MQTKYVQQLISNLSSSVRNFFSAWCVLFTDGCTGMDKHLTIFPQSWSLTFPIVPFTSSSCLFSPPPPPLSWTQETRGVWRRGDDPALQAPQGAEHLCSCLWEKSGPGWHLPLTPDKTTPIWWVNSGVVKSISKVILEKIYYSEKLRWQKNGHPLE